MSTLIKFIKWLKGEKPKPSLSEIRTHLKLLEMRLQRYEKELSLKRKKTLKSVRSRLKQGDIAIAREQARQVILLDRDLINVMQLRTKVSEIRNKVERGLIMKDLVDTIKNLVPYMAQIAEAIGDADLSKAMREIMETSEKMSVGEEMLATSIETLSVSDEEVEDAAEELLRRLAEREGVKIPEERISEGRVSLEAVERILKEVMEEE